MYQEAFLAAIPIVKLGSELQKSKYLPHLAAGTHPASPAITEPEGGSTFKDMSTEAVKKDDEWVINGEKTHIHFGPKAGVLTLYAQTEEGLTTFLVEGDNPGITVVEKMKPIGDRISPMYHLEFNDVRVPHERILGDVGSGFDVFFTTFNYSRIGQASRMIGLGQLCLDRALDWGSQREVKQGKYVTDFQGNKWTIADTQTKLQAARRLRDEAAWAMANDRDDIPLRSSMAKLAATHFSLPAIHESLQLMGGNGHYYKPFEPFMDYLGEYFIFRIGGGHRDILRDFIADEILNKFEI
jgi:alkylation response protein AidB-like acyl-CoA dehydrogenase